MTDSVDQKQLLDPDFFTFWDSKTDKHSVICLRGVGNHGMLQSRVGLNQHNKKPRLRVTEGQDFYSAMFIYRVLPGVGISVAPSAHTKEIAQHGGELHGEDPFGGWAVA